MNPAIAAHHALDRIEQSADAIRSDCEVVSAAINHALDLDAQVRQYRRVHMAAIRLLDFIDAELIVSNPEAKRLLADLDTEVGRV